jgi:predicted polyphosphate/ATP-dependent NAD kinase
VIESGKDVKKLGLIVNPVAGMGGRVGLKGTDGPDILDKALKLGAKPLSESRSKEALLSLIRTGTGFVLITGTGRMGENASRECGLSPEVVGISRSGGTTAEDTIKAAAEMLEKGVDLLLFAGGDGTARDIAGAVDEKIVVLGIPTGVKIHSAVFAQNPQRAGELAAFFLAEKIKGVRSAEVMDIDEEEFRKGRLTARLHGYLRIPSGTKLLQRLKCGSSVSEKYSQEAIAHEVVKNMTDDTLYIIGPGTTTRAILEKLNLDGTLLGVDAVEKKKLVGRDLNESQILRLIEEKKSRLIITPIGGQGYLFGRGNQQISPAVLGRIGKGGVWIVAAKNKINDLRGRPLLLDSGDRDIDRNFSGYYRIMTGYNEAIIYKVDI